LGTLTEKKRREPKKQKKVNSIKHRGYSKGALTLSQGFGEKGGTGEKSDRKNSRIVGGGSVEKPTTKIIQCHLVESH